MHEDDLTQSFSLGYHFHSSYEGEGRTQVSDIVHKAKPYNKPPSQDNYQHADILVNWFISFFQRHPSYLQSDYLVAVPSSKQKQFDLPTYIVSEISKKLGLEDGTPFVTKLPHLTSQKDVSIEARSENIKDGFTISDNHPFHGKLVTIIDDIYDTGHTINELGRLIASHGATVQGVTGTRVKRKANDLP